MLGPELRTRIHGENFRPYRLLLADGETIDIDRRDGVSVASFEVRG